MRDVECELWGVVGGVRRGLRVWECGGAGVWGGMMGKRGGMMVEGR